MKEAKLLNCPFCGGESEICDGYIEEFLKTEYMKYVQCNYCKASTKLYFTEKEAIKAWNTRKPMERILERLKRKKNPTLLLGPSWLSREERISQQKGYCKAFEEAIEIVKEEGEIE